jgi:hypothetical protein
MLDERTLDEPNDDAISMQNTSRSGRYAIMTAAKSDGWAGTRRALLARAVLVASAAFVLAPACLAKAQTPTVDALSRLTAEQRQVYDAWRSARTAFEAEYDAYWAAVDARRDGRRKKRAAGQPFTAADYVPAFPPKYAGPILPDAITKAMVDPAQPTPPPALETQLPTVNDYRIAALTEHGFAPEQTTEIEFKRRYAAEALTIGLSKDQVIRVYALETGGNGTYDMQSGLHPVTRLGKPISSAIGYAQLLSGNSVGELLRHGEGFARRLDTMAANDQSGVPWRSASLRRKAGIVRAMVADVKTVPDEWGAHVKFGGTPKGMAIHALNLDADVGPWLQVIKLKGLKETAATEAGRTALSGAEMELMNLAGPRTGLEMMTPLGRTIPTPNFFSRGGYERNSVVRERIASDLLLELGRRMELGLLKPGSIEFAAAFDAVAAGR